MTDPTKLHRLFSDQGFENDESRYPTRAVVESYDGNTLQVTIPSFDGGRSRFPITFDNGQFDSGDLVLVVKDEADSYWLIGTQYPSSAPPPAASSGGTNAADGGSSGAGGGPGSLPSKGLASLNKMQQTFAQRLQSDIGLEPAVICGWVHAEEPASATQAPNGANNWLNIGAFDAGNWAGGGSDVWSTPTKGADATASFILGKGVNGISSPMHAADTIHAITAAAGKSVAEQISAIQNSGWASSGYPDLAQDVALFQ